jgi:hypothetical protein
LAVRRAGFSLPRHESFAITVGFAVIGLGTDVPTWACRPHVANTDRPEREGRAVVASGRAHVETAID